MNGIHSRTDCLLDPCFYKCFVCSQPFDEPPKLDSNGRLTGRALVFEVVNEDCFKEETEERICNKCWNSDLSQFSVNQDTRFKPIFIPD
jgi:hypothetical protein